ncbi:hypothetical protein L8R85_23465 [Vibrio splendidus]|uniref:Uncharacterized protein n=2 Tax=Vibrio TaxID=662 RepID=A0AA43G2U8_VIBSP|nr:MULTISPECIES: hypothetical protein [Vibrio]MDH5923976.1 hypothetical protein [Vibrio splendidus]MDH5953175.1 hypothetical protein [Vibrio crassostreae]TCM99759.1 hypothetical protein EDB35_1497 [Vibrio crassostreae]CAK3009405.1 exported hypothetical protein [Vibrio crassostreae]CAK3608540.1 exported hypothetical protein [Vibrio crassostreae]
MIIKNSIAILSLITASVCHATVIKVVTVTSSFDGLIMPKVEVTLNSDSFGMMRYVKSLHQFESIEFGIDTKVDNSASSINVVLNSADMTCKSGQLIDIPITYATDWDIDFGRNQMSLGSPSNMTFSGSTDGAGNYIDANKIKINLYKKFSSYENSGARCNGFAVLLFEAVV